MSQTLHIQPFERMEASPAEYAGLNKLINQMRKETHPDDPPIPLEETIQNIKTIPPIVEVKFWTAWTAEEEMVGYATATLYRTEENKHIAPFDVQILPEFRRQGLGRQMLNLITETARMEERRLLLTQTIDRVPAGEAWMQRMGARKGLETHINQLKMADLKDGLVEEWLRHGQESREAFALGTWDGPYPEDKLDEIAELYDLTNQQPHGELEVEDIHMTPEQLRQMETNIFARGGQRWTFYAIDRESGKFAGYTETVWNPNRPEILSQDMTGVFPQYRNKGLGRWLKAAMLDKVIKERPQVKYVRTGNADSNAAMLKINHELGFKPYMASAIWQVELDKVREYLGH
jgi:GNAT superfamily N-acetyltransferase